MTEHLEHVIGPDGHKEDRLAGVMRVISEHAPTYGQGFRGVQTVAACGCGDKLPAHGYGGWWAWHVAHVINEYLDTRPDLRNVTASHIVNEGTLLYDAYTENEGLRTELDEARKVLGPADPSMSLAGHIRSLTIELEQWKATHGALVQQLFTTRAPVVTVNADDADGALRIAEAFADVDRLQAEVRRVIGERDQARADHAAETSKLRQRCDLLTEQLTQRDTEITKRRKRVLQLRAEVALLTNERDQARTALEHANRHSAEWRTRNEQIETARTEQAQTIQRLRTELRVATGQPGPAPADKAVDLLTELIGLVENPIRARELDNWFSDIANISDRALALIGQSECKETAEPAWAVCGAKKFDGRDRVLFECTETGPHDRHRDRAVSWPA